MAFIIYPKKNAAYRFFYFLFALFFVRELRRHIDCLNILFAILFYIFIFIYHHLNQNHLVIIHFFFLLYRKLQYFLAVLSLYTCSVSLFLKSFIAPLPLYVVIIETVVNVFFMVDIFLTFFVAYIDKTTLEVVDKKKEIFINAVKTVPLHIFMAFPFELLGMQHHPSSESYHIFTALCIIRLCRYLRVNHLLHE